MIITHITHIKPLPNLFTNHIVLNTYVNHSFAKLKNIDDIKKLSLDSMFNLMKDHHKIFNSLNKLKPQQENNEKRKQEVLTNVGDIYNELYDVYKSKYSKKTR